MLSSAAVLAAWSPDAADSDYFRREMRIAEGHRGAIHACVDPSMPCPAGYSPDQLTMLGPGGDGFEAGWQKVFSAIEERVLERQTGWAIEKILALTEELHVAHRREGITSRMMQNVIRSAGLAGGPSLNDVVDDVASKILAEAADRRTPSSEDADLSALEQRLHSTARAFERKLVQLSSALDTLQTRSDSDAMIAALREARALASDGALVTSIDTIASDVQKLRKSSP